MLDKKQILDVAVRWEKSFAVSPEDLSSHVLGKRVQRVWRRGKMLFVELENECTLAIHLRMTGQLVFVARAGGRFGAGHPSDSLVDSLPDRSTRVIFTLDSGTLYFNDQRKFGRIQLVMPGGVENLDFVARMGPEPLENSFTLAVFEAALSRYPRRMIKAALLDQSTIAGVGNIYADEALWGAALHPARQVCSLTAEEKKQLWAELRAVMKLSIEQGGSTDRNYVDAEGKRGAYLDFARVFRKQGRPCLRCGTPIAKIRCVGRGTHLCPDCQRYPLKKIE